MNTTVMEGKDRVLAGRVRLLFYSPFFGTLAAGLRLIEDESIWLFATDGEFLVYNPKNVNGVSQREIEGCLAHEVMHLVLMTHTRKGNRDHKLWNVATDHAINIILYDAGFVLPEGVLFDEKFRDWTAERIYEYLQQNPDQQPKDGGQWNIGEVEPGGTRGEEGEKGSAPETQGNQTKALEGQMKSKVQAAVIAGEKAGNLPGNIKRLIDKICRPKACWREILQRFISEKAFNDWDYTQSHTRMLHSYGVIYPTIDGDQLGELAIIVDTSGSVDEEQLAQFAGEISDILDNYETKVTVVYCDTKVNHVEEFTSEDLPLRLAAVGRGGTLGLPAYEYVQENILEKEAIIHYTDSFLFDWNKIPRPETPVLMACTSRRVDREVPDWVEVIDIS